MVKYRRHLKELPCYEWKPHKFLDRVTLERSERPHVCFFSEVEDDEKTNEPRYTKLIEVVTNDGVLEYMPQYFDRGRREGRRLPVFRAKTLQSILSDMREKGFINFDATTIAVSRLRPARSSR